MPSVWLTYAWDDNKSGDVDYVAQELETVGISVKLDRWNLSVGRRLWEQIADNITNPDLSDAWILYATQTSLGSEACKEEFAYALDRALHSRGNEFPVIALISSPVDQQLIPAGIRTRLFVSLTDPYWKERISAAVKGIDPSIERPTLDPYYLRIHSLNSGASDQFAIEVRPRAGTWSPFFAAIPAIEKNKVQLGVRFGPSGCVPSGTVLWMAGDGSSDDGNWWVRFASNEASPSQSYYLICKELPSELMFGVKNGSPQYHVNVKSVYL